LQPCPDWLWCSPSLLSKGHWGSFLLPGGKRPRREAEYNLHLVMRLRMRGAIPPLPNMPVWRGAQLNHRDNFTFTFYFLHDKPSRWIYIYCIHLFVFDDWRDWPRHWTATWIKRMFNVISERVTPEQKVAKTAGSCDVPQALQLFLNNCFIVVDSVLSL